jgi:CBS domain containing-hemolysin-like protein
METNSTQWITLIQIILLLAINAFFVAAEFALVKAKQVRLAQLSEQSRTGRMAFHIHQHIEPYLAACQLGITMASLGLGWVGEPFVAALIQPLFIALGLPEEVMHTAAFLIGFVLFSALHIVIGEQVPKNLAIREPEPVALWVAWPLRGFFVLVYPFSRLLDLASAGILKSMGVKPASHLEVFTDEEIKGIIDQSRASGEIGNQKADMLTNLFELEHRNARELMTPRGDVDVLDVQYPTEQLLHIIMDTQHSRFPVVEGGFELVHGVVLVKDLYRALLSGDQQPWGHLRDFCRPALMLPDSLNATQLFEQMRGEQAHMGLVVDEYGEVIGLITLEDVLEELVGDIGDELDDRVAEYPIEQMEQHWEAHGLADLADVSRKIGFKVSTAIEAHTLSGFFMERLGRIPEANDQIEESGFTLKVLEVRDRRVERVWLAKTVEEGDHF